LHGTAAMMNARIPYFVVATPGRSVSDNHARALHEQGLLRFLALGTRRGTAGIPRSHTRLNPWIGLFSYAATCVVSPRHAESFRFRLLPWFDRWVVRQLQPGDCILSSYGYTNACFRFVRQHGGKTFLEAGNSHPENFWAVVSEEHRRWNCPYPPFAHHWHERSKAMMADVDYVLSPSSYVANTFLARGFRPEQIFKCPFPLDFTTFTPAADPRPQNRPLTIINTGSLSLRKGTPYLLEAFRIVRRRIPTARLLLTDLVQDDVKPVLARFNDLPIEWSPPLPHAQLAARLQSADIFVLPSLEEGLVRTALEAMACGLPAILTPHTGANDFIQPGVNGDVVPIRDPQATADAILKWGERILAPGWQPRLLADLSSLSYENFARSFISQLRSAGVIHG
jgi:alpha-maltose-1-phosphate synthase